MMEVAGFEEVGPLLLIRIHPAASLQEPHSTAWSGLQNFAKIIIIGTLAKILIIHGTPKKIRVH
jgi:hypothetical protein